eukprot:scaffold886_cov174-Ochromonas_danica.AAC.6
MQSTPSPSQSLSPHTVPRTGRVSTVSLHVLRGAAAAGLGGGGRGSHAAVPEPAGAIAVQRAVHSARRLEGANEALE